MKNKRLQLVLILIGLLIITILFSLLSNKVRRSDDNEETTKKVKHENTSIINETTKNESSSMLITEEFETPMNTKISKVTPDLRKTVKDFSEIENKLLEIKNAYYPDTKSIEFIKFKQDKEKYSYTFNLKGNLDHEVTIFYWLKDKSLSYQHY